ncbi:hypothetical protein MLD38_036199 [Melastoma candidum]|uniref:Uncharacterized protein n=1 Tax=Melastoma candidum TaxID=119954 RepID=A0ACB9LJI6_9MYRT|nr:hypothetical protein MLD38_036199 [Melastoma candidum]
MQHDSSNPNPNPNPTSSPSPNSSSVPDPPPSPPTEPSTDPSPSSAEDDALIDVSGETLDYPLPNGPSLTVSDPKGVYFYKNRVNLLPRWVNSFPKLRTFKFFANDVELLPEGFGELVGLERLQVRLSFPELGNSGLVDELGKLEGLKELELSNVVRRKSALHFFAEISRLKCLTRLTLCHFSIRCLPPEIGNLNQLEYLDLSFNKMKTLPNEITYLSSLTSLKVASNKLAELPAGISCMRRLEVLDFSHNRLTSLGPLDLCSMQNLQSLNLQYNKIYNCKIPPWLSCKIEGNGFSGDESITAFSEMDVYEATMQEDKRSFSHEGSGVTSACILGPSATSSNGRCFLNRKSSKRWKRTDLQQRARQERLNSSRKGKAEKHSDELVKNIVDTSDPCDSDVISHDILGDVESEIVGLDDDSDKASTSEVNNISQILSNPADEPESVSGYELCLEDTSGVVLDSISEVGEEDRCLVLGCLASTEPSKSEKDLVAPKAFLTPNSKRHCDGNLDNPKPCKFRKPTDEALHLSRKYSDISICGVEDYLPDGFYDGGRDQHFMPLNSYEEKLHLDSREVILIDRQRDEVLDAVVLTAQALVSHFRRLNDCGKDYEKDYSGHLQVASLLALFVSDHFGGCDRTALIESMRKAVSGHNYTKPFICTCSTGNCERVDGSTRSGFQESEDVIFNDLCESSLSSIKSKRKSVIVPIGSLKFGVCRHRALLLKYLCDRMSPPVPCELVRGYLDYMPHAWNVVVMKKDATWVRMVVDACHPYDIREETDPEYFCRYLPLSRISNTDMRETVGCSSECFSLKVWDEVERMASTSVVHCKSGSVDVAAKVRTIEVSCNAIDEIRRFECSCLGEVRILGALKHACIVELYGHRISSEWITSEDANPKRRRLKSAIYMEYIKGGSLKNYLEKLSQSGETHAPFDIALFIAKDVASALVELHSKHIIHRDIKSENVLINLDEGSSNGIPVVKLCDFDRAVPLKSTQHSCCISHIGVHPPNMCVGTPRWLAPEVLKSMHEQSQYGLEVDIWSYGCLLFELLTLQVPYQEVPVWNIHGLLQSGERPKLTDEIESLISSDDTATCSSLQKVRLEFDMEAFRTLVDLFRQCTQKNPTDRPSAGDIYKSLLDRANSFTNRCSRD